MIRIYEGVTYRENFKKSLFRKLMGKLFALRQKHKDEKKCFIQRLVKVNMNSVHGVQIRKDTNETCYCKSETWMKTEYDENVLDYLEIT